MTNTIVTQYPDGVQILMASKPIFGSMTNAKTQNRPTYAEMQEDAVEWSSTASSERRLSQNRAAARRRIYGIMRMNPHLNHFTTLTLDKSRVISRYDPATVTRTLNQWLSNAVRRHGLEYLVIPELHKDGAIHFHGMLSQSTLTLKDSGLTNHARPLYNLPGWSYGFSTVSVIPPDEMLATIAYVAKYISKQPARVLGRWYYSSAGLARPIPIQIPEMAIPDYTHGLVEQEVAEYDSPIDGVRFRRVEFRAPIAHAPPRL